MLVRLDAARDAARRAGDERMRSRVNRTITDVADARGRLALLTDQGLRLSHSCERCGSTFEVSRSDARYCSSRCRTAAYRARTARHLCACEWIAADDFDGPDDHARAVAACPVHGDAA